MSAPVREPDDGPSKDGPLNYAPKKVRDPERDQNVAGARGNTVAHSSAPESAEPPWRHSRQRRAFVGDVGVSELRSQLALAPDRVAEPPPPPVSTGSKYALGGRLAGVAVVAVVGVVGYQLGAAPPASSPQPAVSSGKPDDPGLASKSLAGRPATGGLSTGAAVRSVPSGAAVAHAAPSAPPPQSAEPAFASSSASPPAVSGQLAVNAVQPQRVDEPARLAISAIDAGANAAVVIGGLAPGSTVSSGTQVGPNAWRLSVDELTGAAVTPRRGFVGPMDLALELRLADNAIVDRKNLHLEWLGRTAPAPAKSQPRQYDAAEITLMMKGGAELMANGDIAAARMMYLRAAEAGEAAAAFALAETYDPLVLGKLNAKGGITPDVALAHSWYEKAKDLGYAVASERLERLARLPD